MKKLLFTLGVSLLALGASAVDKEITVSYATGGLHNGSLTGSEGNYNRYWVSSATDPQLTLDVQANNIEKQTYGASKSNDVLWVYDGSNASIKPLTFSFTCTTGWYISRVTFDATAPTEAMTLITNEGEYSLTVGSEAKHVDIALEYGTNPIIKINGNNKAVCFANFKVTLAHAPWTGPNMTTDMSNPRTYYIINERSHNTRGKTMAVAPASGQVALKTTTEWEALEDKDASKWYFVEDKTVTGLLPAIKAVKIYNVAHTEPLANPTDGTFSSTTNQTWYIMPNGTGYAISNNLNNIDQTGTSWNDAAGNATAVGYYQANDAGSIWSFTYTETPASEAEIAAFDTAKANVVDNYIPDLTHYRALIGDVYYNAEVQPVIDEINALTLPENPTSPEAVALTSIPMAKINACYATIMAQANGRVIYLKNKRRSEDNGKYLTALADNHVNTTGFPTAESSWVIVSQGNNTFKLFNPELNGYIQKQATESGQITLGTAADAAVYKLANNTDASNPGTAIYQTNVPNTAYGLNVDTYANNAVVYRFNDGGSSWTVELAGMTAEQAAAAGGKYIRIRSMRSLHTEGRRTNGSLLGVNTVVENGVTAAATMAINNQKMMSFGTIWKLEPTSTAGKFNIINVASQFENQNNGDALGVQSAPANVGGNYGVWEFKNGLDITNADVAPSVYARQYDHGLVIHSNTTNIDVSDSSTGVSGWNNVNNNWPENGGLFIVEEVGEAEYNTYLNAYLAGAKNSAIARDQQYVTDFGENSLFDSSAIEAAAASADYAVPETVIAANSYLANNPGPITNDVVNTALRSAIGKHFLWKCRRDNTTSGHNHPYITADYTGTERNLDTNNAGAYVNNNPLRAVWQMEPCDTEGYFYLRHHGNGGYVKHPGSQSSDIKISDKASATKFTLHYIPSQRGFSFSTNGQINQNASGIHVAAGMGIVSWEAQNDFSVYDLFALDTEVPVSVTADTDNGELTINFDADGTLEITPTSEAIGALHTIQLNSVAARSRSVGFGEEVTRDDLDDSKSVTITDFEPGSYVLTVPAGFFRNSQSKVLSAPVNYTFSVNGDGTVTNIDEISAEAPADGAIYDLQGRRLAAPVKGINIIGGRKVLIK